MSHRLCAMCKTEIIRFPRYASVSTIFPISFCPSTRLQRFTPINFLARSRVVKFFNDDFNSPKLLKSDELSFESAVSPESDVFVFDSFFGRFAFFVSPPTARKIFEHIGVKYS